MVGKSRDGYDLDEGLGGERCRVLAVACDGFSPFCYFSDSPRRFCPVLLPLFWSTRGFGAARGRVNWAFSPEDDVRSQNPVAERPKTVASFSKSSRTTQNRREAYRAVGDPPSSLSFRHPNSTVPCPFSECPAFSAFTEAFYTENSGHSTNPQVESP